MMDSGLLVNMSRFQQSQLILVGVKRSNIINAEYDAVLFSLDE